MAAVRYREIAVFFNELGEVTFVILDGERFRGTDTVGTSEIYNLPGWI